ncbi:hypothetical protein ACR9GP_21340 [Enterobacter ludwigii]
MFKFKSKSKSKSKKSSSTSDNEGERLYSNKQATLPRELGIQDLVVNNNEMEFSRALRTGKSGENSMAFDSMHKQSGKKYITKSLLRGPQTSAYLNAKREVFAYSLSEKLSLGIVPHTAHIKIVPKKIRFNGQIIDDYNLPISAPFGLIYEYVISRKIEGNTTQEMIMGYNRKQSPLYVFDYILGQTDREDSYTTNSKGESYVRNIVYDKNGNMYAIDHSIILHPSLNNPMHLNKEVVDVFMSNSGTADAIKNTNWEEFFDGHFKDVTEKDEKYTHDIYLKEKEGFLNRVRDVIEVSQSSNLSVNET